MQQTTFDKTNANFASISPDFFARNGPSVDNSHVNCDVGHRSRTFSSAGVDVKQREKCVNPAAAAASAGGGHLAVAALTNTKGEAHGT